jgi:hypothetical protein
MATVRISQLTAITAATDDDVFIINDADTNTRKITYANLVQGLLNTSSVPQTKTGPLTISGALTSGSNFLVGTNALFVDALNSRVGVKNTNPQAELDVDGIIRVRNANSVQFGDINTSNWVAIRGPGVVPANFSLTLPDALPSASNLLVSSSTGILSFSSGVTYNSADSSLELNAVKLTNQGFVRFYENETNGVEFIQFNAPSSLTTTNSYTLPSAFPPSSGHLLSATSTGVLSWVSSTSGAAGSTSEIQYNGGAGLAANSNFTFQPGIGTMSVPTAVITTELDAQGDVSLGTTVTDTVTISGVINSDVIPNTGTETLGNGSTSWGALYVDDLHVTNGVVTNLLPSSGVETLGDSANKWAEVHSEAYHTGAITVQTTDFQSAVASGNTFVTALGPVGVFGSFKVLIHVSDTINGNTEFYEYFVTHDGSNVSEVAGANVQSTPGTFLTTPAASVSGGSVILTLTNSAVSTNDINIKLQNLAFFI